MKPNRFHSLIWLMKVIHFLLCIYYIFDIRKMSLIFYL
nr:MAG TPA: hypothetical protein [Caudoviricetes sp.]